MFKFAKRYLQVFAGLLLGLGVYKLTVVPAIEPTPQVKQEIPGLERALGGVRWWESFFPEDAWQRQDPKIINTHQGILLAHRWNPIDDKTWELKPLTMILPHSRSARLAIQENQTQAMLERDMWIVSAAEGATIHFQEPLDIASGQVPTVVRGELSGAIEVTRKVASEGEKKPWRIRTRDLTIDRRQLSTEREVFIEWDDSVIQGRALKILLRGDLLGSQGAQQSAAWGPLDELKLYHVEQIDLALPPGGIWADFDSERFEAEPHLRTLPARIHATCGGRFAFDFKTSTATLQNRVHLKHQLGDLPPDEFLCERISLTLEPPANVRGASQESAAIKLQQFEATGVDSLRDIVGEKWVELNAPTVDVSARAKVLKVDMVRQRIELSGRINQPNATQSIVLLNYQGTEFRSPRIEYQAAPAATGMVRHLGWMVAAGPGELQTSEKSELGKVQIRWQQALKMAPSPDRPQKQWIEILGNTLVDSAAHGILATNRLEVWLQKRGESDSLPPSDASATHKNSLPLAGIPGTGKYLPERVYASGNTLVTTDTLRAQVPELDVSLIYAPVEVPVAAGKTDELALQDSAGNPMYQWVKPPEEPSGSIPIATENPAQAQAEGVPPEPVNVTGSSLVANIVVSGQETWLDRLQIAGPVKIWKPADASQPMPWHVEGDQLLLATNRSGQADMQIEGTPAKIVVAEGFLQGELIRFDQASNLIWMNHPGEFTIPISVLNRGPDREPAVVWTSPPHCRWNGKMVFDGVLATIEGAIEFDAALAMSPDSLWWIKGTSQRLSVSLSQPVSLEENAVETAQIERIELSEKVNIRASELNRQGDKKSRQQIVVPSLMFHLPQNQIVGSGPGWIRSKYLSDDKPGRLASMGRSNSVAGQGASLQGAHLKFRDSLVGFLDREEFVFDGKVEVGVGPMRSWDDMIDVNRMQSLSLDQMLLNCDQIKVYDTGGLSRFATELNSKPSNTWEMQATGHVAFNGKSEAGDFLGAGYQITYAQAKELLILRGDGRTAAWLQRIPSPGSDRSFQGEAKLYVESIAINPRTLDPRDIVIGQGGFQMQMGDGNSPGQLPQRAASGAPLLPGSPPRNAPNPRQDFYNRR